MVRERLDAAPTPEMWCYLGDFTEETFYAVRRWTVAATREPAPRVLCYLSPVLSESDAWVQLGMVH